MQHPNSARTVRLGDAEVVRIGLGTNRLTNTLKNVAFVKEAVAAGINLIDTAHSYAGGQSEATIGAALSPIPDGVIVATKGGYGSGQGRPQVLREQIDESLRRLRTDTIALYYLHRVDPETPLEESLGAIKEYVDRGRSGTSAYRRSGSTRSSGRVPSSRSQRSRTSTTSPSAGGRTSSTTVPARRSCSFPTFRSTSPAARH